MQARASTQTRERPSKPGEHDGLVTPGVQARASRRRRAKLSKPGEHGGLVTLLGSVVLVTWVAPEPWAAFAASLVYVIAYLARGPVERMARGFRLQAWDGPALGVYGLVAVLATLGIARQDLVAGLVTLGTALVIPAAGAVVSRARVHRTFVVELAGLAACGGSAGVALHAGGAGMAACVAVGLAMASYAASAVALVRAEVRDLEPRDRKRLSRVSLALLAMGCVATTAIGPNLALAFAVRLVHAAWHALRGPGTHPIAVIATRETMELAMFVVLLALALTGVMAPVPDAGWLQISSTATNPGPLAW